MDDEEEIMDVQGEGADGELTFEFTRLPAEIQEETLKKLNTSFLENVCARVCTTWEGMVSDILEKRKIHVGTIIPEFFQDEMALRVEPETLNDSLERLKYYERIRVSNTFDVTAVEVNRDVMLTEAGLLYHLWRHRDCDCTEYPECLLRTVHLLESFNLFVVCIPSSSSSGPRFFHLSNIMSLSPVRDFSTTVSYRCEPKVRSWLEPNQSICKDISVYRDHILLEIATKTLLLIKISSVDHEREKVYLERLRIIHLPIWTARLCLFENKLIALYSTGYVGMWDKEKDELFMSAKRCDMKLTIYNRFIHRTKIYRMGNLALIKIDVSASRRSLGDRYEWYAVDINDTMLKAHPINICQMMDAGVIEGTQYKHTEEVLHIDLWYNCLIVHLQVKVRDDVAHLFEHSVQRQLFFKLVKRYPTLEDLKDSETFRSIFQCTSIPLVPRLSLKTTFSGHVSIPASFLMSFTSPIAPPFEKNEKYNEPPPGEPAPVGDLIGVQLTPQDSSSVPARNKLKVFRIRISNLPFSYSSFQDLDPIFQGI